MFETDASGFPVQAAGLDAEWLLTLADESVIQKRVAERRQLHYALWWAQLHPATDESDAARWSDAGGDLKGVDVLLGGVGSPLVAAYAAEPLAAALKMSTRAGMQLMADALELERLPHLNARVEDLSVEPWRARRVAAETVGLSPEAAAYVDAQLATVVDRCGPKRIDDTVADAIARFDPEATAVVEDEAEKAWDVTITHGVGPTWSGTSSIEITGDTALLKRFHEHLCAIAHGLLDPTRSAVEQPDLKHRKITALGVMVDQSHGCPAGSGATTTAKTKLFVHANLTDLTDTDETGTGTDGAAMGYAEKLGPITVERIKDWVGHSRVTIQPIIDLNRTDIVDEHDPPAWMREFVIQRDTRCVFPWCDQDSRSCDLDHIEAYLEPIHGGPPGQTRPDNLAPLCRRHHRAKTHGRWRYTKNRDGTYTWNDPVNRVYLTNPRSRAGR